MQWGAWFELTDKSEKLTTSSLCFLADVFQNLPSQLPDAKANESWFPTVTMAIEFKCPIPEASEYYASRTVGIYSCELSLSCICITSHFLFCSCEIYE